MATLPPPDPTPPAPTPISATAIARHLGRKPSNVIAAIARLGIPSTISLTSGNYYPPDVIPQIEAGMRRRNAHPQG